MDCNGIRSWLIGAHDYTYIGNFELKTHDNRYEIACPLGTLGFQCGGQFVEDIYECIFSKLSCIFIQIPILCSIRF